LARGLGPRPVPGGDQHVGYRLAQRLVLGDRGEMLLALLLALATRSVSSSRSDSVSTGRATSTSSSKASIRTTPCGALGTPASRIESLARAVPSIADVSLAMTSSNRSI